MLALPYSPLPRQTEGVSQQQKDEVELWAVVLLLLQREVRIFSRWMSAVMNFALRRCFQKGTWYHCRCMCVCALTHLSPKTAAAKGWDQFRRERERCRPSWRRQARKCGCLMSLMSMNNLLLQMERWASVTSWGEGGPRPQNIRSLRDITVSSTWKINPRAICCSRKANLLQRWA